MEPSALNGGFRHRYLDYDALTRQLQAWAQAYPALVELQSIATTPQGRDIWVLTIGPEPQRPWYDHRTPHAASLAGYLRPGPRDVTTPGYFDAPAALSVGLMASLCPLVVQPTPHGDGSALKPECQESGR